jgi:translation initiation factor 1A
MPRNLRGGKAFKKGKKAKPAGEGGESHVQRFEEPDRAQGVDYARVLRALGNRRMLCFCNDGVERVCKIRGALCKGPKRQKIEIGDIVLVSYRAYMTADSDDDDESDEDEEAEAGVVATTVHRGGGGSAAAGASEMAPTVGAATLDSGRKDIGDIIFKYDSRNWRIIRKQAGIHVYLFGEAAGGGGSALDDDIFRAADEDEEREGDTRGSGVKEEEDKSDGEMDDSDIDAI